MNFELYVFRIGNDGRMLKAAQSPLMATVQQDAQLILKNRVDALVRRQGNIVSYTVLERSNESEGVSLWFNGWALLQTNTIQRMLRRALDAALPNIRKEHLAQCRPAIQTIVNSYRFRPLPAENLDVRDDTRRTPRLIDDTEKDLDLASFNAILLTVPKQNDA